MLVVMENRNIQEGFQPFLDFKTAWRADIFQIDAAEGGSYIDNGADNFFRILCIQADGNCIDIAEFLEQNRFSLHDGHGGIGADISKAQYGAAVRYHGHGVGFPCIGVGRFRIFGNYLAGLRHAGGVGEGEILAGFDGGFRNGFQFAAPFFM